MTQVIYLTDDYVGVNWLRALSIFPDNTGIANQLPNPWDGDAGKSSWESSDFITIICVGGNETGDPEESNPVYTIDCWHRPKNRGSSPLWARANLLAEAIRHEERNMTMSVQVNTNGPYPGFVVSDVTILSKPRRIDGDPNGLARYSMDVSIVYRPED